MHKTAKHKHKVARALLVAYLVLGGIFALWLFVSWVEIARYSLEPNPTYSPWNAWVLVSEVTNG